MAKEEVKAKAKDENDKEIPIVCQYDFGGSLDGFIKKASQNGGDGKAVAWSKVKASDKIDIQDIMRRLAVTGKSQADIQKVLDAHVPGVKKRGKSKSEKMKDDFDALSADERARLIAELTGG
jgi:hypothetical protein